MKFINNTNLDILKDTLGVGSTTSISIGSKGNCWLGLLTAIPSGSSSSASEPPRTSNYDRVNIAVNGGLSNAYKSYSLQEQAVTTHYDRLGNTYNIRFNPAIDPDDEEATTGFDWTGIVAVGLFKERTGSNLYAWAELPSSVTVQTGWSLNFLPGRFEISIGEIIANPSV